MQFSNTLQCYGVVSVTLHWLTAIAVYGVFALGLWIVTLSYYDGWYHQTSEPHKSIGILLMMGLVIHVIWRLFFSPPAVLASYSRLTRIAAATGHLALYLPPSSVVISGRLISVAGSEAINVFGWLDIPTTPANTGSQAGLVGSLYLWLAWAVTISSLLHRLMTLKHHFINNDDTLSRMLGKSPSDHKA